MPHLPTDSGLGHVTDLDQGDVSKHNASRDLFSWNTLFWSHHIKSSTYPPGETTWREREMLGSLPAVPVISAELSDMQGKLSSTIRPPAVYSQIKDQGKITELSAELSPDCRIIN